MILAALVAVGLCAAGAEERLAVSEAPIDFHIPAQPLASALQAYSERTGVQVLYESTSATGRRSIAVDGAFTPADALNLLLTGSDLKVRYIRPDAITLAPPVVDSNEPPASPLAPATIDLSLGRLRIRTGDAGDDTTRFHDYNESIQTDIQRALQKNSRTRIGSYRAVLDLWIDPSRTIQRTELFKSSGDPERDAAVASALRGLVISRPAPSNTPQPIRVVIVVRSAQ
ncbi:MULTISPECIES: secretin and TonB N-terminal domain-containing protein [unclassified Bradyrhizobium]|nr:MULTISPECIES: secretin and TonB N-terminal domain-containing protein [unclassified Bradyrhizobium]